MSEVLPNPRPYAPIETYMQFLAVSVVEAALADQPPEESFLKLPTKLHYHPHDPIAISMTVGVERGGVRWFFARDLLRHILYGEYPNEYEQAQAVRFFPVTDPDHVGVQLGEGPYAPQFQTPKAPLLQLAEWAFAAVTDDDIADHFAAVTDPITGMQMVNKKTRKLCPGPATYTKLSDRGPKGVASWRNLYYPAGCIPR